MEARNLDINGKKIHSRTNGEGDTIMLVHGFGEDGSIWKNQYAIFPGRVIVPDLPGSGHSEMVSDMSVEGMAETLNAILEKENIAQCILIGHSMGGYITLAFAEKYPQKLKGFGLFHSSAFADNDAKKETREKGIAFIKQHGGKAFLDTLIPNLYSQPTKGEHPELLKAHLAQAADLSPESLIAYYKAMIQRPDRTEVLKQSEVPVLFIFGKEDQAVPMEDGLKQCHLPKTSVVEILEKTGHMGMIEETPLANRYLVEYYSLINGASSSV